MKAVIKLTSAREKKLKAFTTKSAGIRYLNSLGYSNGDIARKMTSVWKPTTGKDVRPQHVSNVLHTSVKHPMEKF